MLSSNQKYQMITKKENKEKKDDKQAKPYLQNGIVFRLILNRKEITIKKPLGLWMTWRKYV